MTLPESITAEELHRRAMHAELERLQAEFDDTYRRYVAAGEAYRAAHDELKLSTNPHMNAIAKLDRHKQAMRKAGLAP